ncbi:MAG: pentapeptide repeat-containing protein [Woeseiaceae bacterium]
MNTTKPWYIRHKINTEITGPFPSGQISQEILLGRHKLTDEVSHDKEVWVEIRTVPELAPDIYKEDHDDPQFNDRLAAAKRWADERRGVSKLTNDDRRAGESFDKAEIKRLHKLANPKSKAVSPVKTFIQLSFVFILIASIVVLAFKFSPEAKNKVDCNTPPQQAVNWSGCNLSGIILFSKKLIAANLMNTNLQTANLQSSDLSHANLKFSQLHLSNVKYVNFTKADLTGANFHGADLYGANFNQANLSYANLKDAKIDTANFSGARLSNTIWTDGRTCKVGSIGGCR